MYQDICIYTEVRRNGNTKSLPI